MNARSSLGLAFLLCAATAAAQSPGACPTTTDQTNCVRVLACIGDTGRYFEGRSLGRGSGTLAGLINRTVTCIGIWTERNDDGLGQADVTCNDGLEVTVLYTYQEPFTGTAIGSGTANTGERVTAWSGLHVREYFQRESGNRNPRLPCGGSTDIPIS
ncbi:MAG: hypothetical protein AAGE38_17495 [Pseudomonadota bacterium]